MEETIEKGSVPAWLACLPAWLVFCYKHQHERAPMFRHASLFWCRTKVRIVFGVIILCHLLSPFKIIFNLPRNTLYSFSFSLSRFLFLFWQLYNHTSSPPFGRNIRKRERGKRSEVMLVMLESKCFSKERERNCQLGNGSRLKVRLSVWTIVTVPETETTKN